MLKKLLFRIYIFIQHCVLMFFRIILTPIFVSRYHVHYENRKLFSEIKGAYLLLPNHVMTLDALLVNMGVPKPVHWVANDSLFRTPILGSLLKFCGIIPISRERGDAETIKLLKTYASFGEPTGVFPEGESSWDGKSIPVIPSTAKLVRFLKVPVVQAHIKGGFLCKSRWMKKMRRKRVTISFSMLIDENEIKTMKLSEIEKRMNEGMSFNDFDDQRVRKEVLKSNQRAEGLEYTAYICPSCKRIGTMKSDRNLYHCQDCGFAVSVNQYGFFEQKENTAPFEDLAQWNDWQKEELDKKINNLGVNDTLFEDHNIIFSHARVRRGFKKIGRYDFQFKKDRIVCTSTGRKYPISEIPTLRVFKKDYVEFVHDKTTYRMTFPPCTSSYKWMIAFEKLKELQEKKERLI